MRKILQNISKVLKTIFGYGIMLCLFAGGMTFFGYVAALIIGGDVAATISAVIYKTIIPYIIKISTSMVLLGLLAMYLNGETALTATKQKAAQGANKKKK